MYAASSEGVQTHRLILFVPDQPGRMFEIAFHFCFNFIISRFMSWS